MKNDVGMNCHIPLTVFLPPTLGEPEGKDKGIGVRGHEGEIGVCWGFSTLFLLLRCLLDLQGP